MNESDNPRKALVEFSVKLKYFKWILDHSAHYFVFRMQLWLVERLPLKATAGTILPSYFDQVNVFYDLLPT